MSYFIYRTESNHTDILYDPYSRIVETTPRTRFTCLHHIDGELLLTFIGERPQIFTVRLGERTAILSFVRVYEPLNIFNSIRLLTLAEYYSLVNSSQDFDVYMDRIWNNFNNTPRVRTKTIERLLEFYCASITEFVYEGNTYTFIHFSFEEDTGDGIVLNNAKQCCFIHSHNGIVEHNPTKCSRVLVDLFEREYQYLFDLSHGEAFDDALFPD